MVTRPEGWTKEDDRAWASLNRRFPGLAADAKRTVMKMAVHLGQRAKTRIRHEHRGAGFVAFIEAISPILDPALNPVSYPVIPDEHNAAEGKRITLERAPHVFNDVTSCRAAAEYAETVLAKSLREAESKVLGP